MPIFVTLVKTGSEGAKSLADLDKSYEEGMKMAQQMEIKPIAQYGLLGPYDLMFIYEAADEKAAASSSLFQSAKWGGKWKLGQRFQWRSLPSSQQDLRVEFLINVPLCLAPPPITSPFE